MVAVQARHHSCRHHPHHRCHRHRKRVSIIKFEVQKQLALAIIYRLLIERQLQPLPHIANHINVFLLFLLFFYLQMLWPSRLCRGGVQLNLWPWPVPDDVQIPRSALPLHLWSATAFFWIIRYAGLAVKGRRQTVSQSGHGCIPSELLVTLRWQSLLIESLAPRVPTLLLISNLIAPTQSLTRLCFSAYHSVCLIVPIGFV